MSWLNFYQYVDQDNKVQNMQMVEAVAPLLNGMYQKSVFDAQVNKNKENINTARKAVGMSESVNLTGDSEIDKMLFNYDLADKTLREKLIGDYSKYYKPEIHDKMTTTLLAADLPKSKKIEDTQTAIKTEAAVNPLFAKELAKYKDWEKQPPEYQEAILTHAKERAKQVQENIDYNTKLSIGDAHEKVSKPKDKETTVKYYKDKQDVIRKVVLQKDANGVWRDPQTGEQADIYDMQWLNPNDEILVAALKYGTVKKGIIGKVKGKDPNSMQTPPISGKIDYNKYKRKS